VKKVFPAHRTDLALCKKAGNRYRAHAFLDNRTVMMAMAEESLAAATAAEHERPQRRIAVLGTICSEENL
jgi:hypothetical protein